MQAAFTDNAWDDYLYWQANDADTLEKINDLIKEIKREPSKEQVNQNHSKETLPVTGLEELLANIGWFIEFRALSLIRYLQLSRPGFTTKNFQLNYRIKITEQNSPLDESLNCLEQVL